MILHYYYKKLSNIRNSNIWIEKISKKRNKWFTNETKQAKKKDTKHES